MRKSLLAGLCLFFSSSGLLLAQNKTLGVGVTTPNPNAALHVESPTGNQGFIMPRLTTAQREAMSSLLTATDKGLMLYDTDRSAMFIWDGAGWKSSSEFSLSDTTSTKDLINVLNKGLGVAGKFMNQNRGSKMPALWAQTNSDSTLSAPIYGFNTGSGDVAGSFRIENPANPNGALYGETNGSGPAVYGNQVGLGRGGQFQIVNVANTQAALRSYTAGTGNAGFYTVNNAASDSAAIFSTTNGIGAAFGGLTTGTGSAARFLSRNASSTAPALYTESYSTGGVARFVNYGSGSAVLAHVKNIGSGYFAQHEGTSGYAAILQSVNPENPSPAVFAEAVGPGFSLFVQKSLPESTGDVIFSEHVGTSGHSGRFIINNVANPSVGILSTTNGTGAAIQAENNGPADGIAGLFMTTDPANTYPAIQASTAGVGSGVRVMQTAGAGAGMDVFMHNPSSNAVGMMVDQRGLGEAGSFVISNPVNNMPAVTASTNGTNSAVYATHHGSNGDAIYSEHFGGQGSAGNFRLSNATNPASAVHASTAAPGGNALSVRNDADGIAFAVWQGGMQITTSDITTGTSLATRASAYRITSLDGTTFNIDFGPVNGEIFMIFNDTLQPITITGGGVNTTIPASDGKTFISFNGNIRSF